MIPEPETYLAVAALRILMSWRFRGLFFDYQTLLEKIRSGTIEHPIRAAAKLIRPHSTLTFSMLDDLGAHLLQTGWKTQSHRSLRIAAITGSR